MYVTCYRQQPSPLLYSIDIWPARNSRLTQRETNHYMYSSLRKCVCLVLPCSKVGKIYSGIKKLGVSQISSDSDWLFVSEFGELNFSRYLSNYVQMITNNWLMMVRWGTFFKLGLFMPKSAIFVIFTNHVKTIWPFGYLGLTKAFGYYSYVLREVS